MRRQMTIGMFVADFVCVEARLIIELNGGQHSAPIDAARTAWLEAQGYALLRFWNNEVDDNLDGVLMVTLTALIGRTEGRKSLTQPSPERSGEG